MKDEDVKIGLRVVAHQKTVGINPLKRGILYVIGKSFYRHNLVWVLDSVLNNDGYGNFYRAEDFEPYIESSEEEVSEEKVIVAQWILETAFGYGKAMRVIQSNHSRFIVGSRFDYGFTGIAGEEGYTVIIKPMGDKGK